MITHDVLFVSYAHAPKRAFPDDRNSLTHERTRPLSVTLIGELGQSNAFFFD